MPAYTGGRHAALPGLPPHSRLSAPTAPGMSEPCRGPTRKHKPEDPAVTSLRTLQSDSADPIPEGLHMTTQAGEPPGIGHTFEGKITVGSRIIDYLSSGIYKSPAACLKELVNNSYDADAKLVRVLVKPDADRIIIEDDGMGMTLVTFQAHFDRISESHKRDTSDITPMGRPKIGKIGIGFIAANEICDQMEIFSTVAGSPELLHVTINFEEMRNQAEQSRKGNTGELAKADYNGELLQASDDEHYTTIFLKKIRGHAQDLLIGAARQAAQRRLLGSAEGQVEDTLYGLNAGTVRRRLANLSSWSALDQYSQTMLGVALNVPVRYHNAWFPPEQRSQVKSFEEAVNALGFIVEYDGTELRKPVVLTGGEDKQYLVRTVRFDGEHVGAHAWFYGQRKTLKPEDINGVLIRIRNAAVGEYDDTFLGFPHTAGPLFQRWITCEIYADDRLEDALNIDRRTLREAHSSYVELREWFHEELYTFLAEVRNKLYTEPASERKRNQTEAEVEKLKQVAEAIGISYGEDLSQRISEAWAPPTGRRQPGRADINSKFTVSTLYETVLAVARDTLPEEQARAFIAELTRKLRD